MQKKEPWIFPKDLPAEHAEGRGRYSSRFSYPCHSYYYPSTSCLPEKIFVSFVLFVFLFKDLLRTFGGTQKAQDAQSWVAALLAQIIRGGGKLKRENVCKKTRR
jgi:hypothetical protein